VGAPLKRARARADLREHLEELERLTDTAGAVIVGQLTQQLDKPHSATYLGAGKVEELRKMVVETQATVVVFDDELSPSQSKNIEDAIGQRVVDRAELILDIFATRARTAEAKMQVELAQLEYMLPRLTRMWTHLEKFRGGIGVRGPGETQLETDRRLINQRIKVLREKLREFEKGRAVQRSARRSEFKAALVGYTNAGKSSLLRSLANADEVFVEDRLFATLDPLTREVQLGENSKALVTDTVGFIRKLPHHLVASFRATLEEAREADLLLHVIDANHAMWEEQRDVVNGVLAELELEHQPQLYVFNKIDLLPEPDLLALQDRMASEGQEAVFVSTIQEHGVDPLKRALQSHMRARRPLAQIHLSPSEGKLLAEIHEYGEVLDQRTIGEELVLRARVGEKLAGRLRRAGAVVEREAPGDSAAEDSTAQS
jgi:GTPase